MDQHLNIDIDTVQSTALNLAGRLLRRAAQMVVAQEKNILTNADEIFDLLALHQEKSVRLIIDFLEQDAPADLSTRRQAVIEAICDMRASKLAKNLLIPPSFIKKVQSDQEIKHKKHQERVDELQAKAKSSEDNLFGSSLALHLLLMQPDPTFASFDKEDAHQCFKVATEIALNTAQQKLMCLGSNQPIRTWSWVLQEQSIEIQNPAPIQLNPVQDFILKNREASNQRSLGPK